jgi:hypothetical protein
MKFYLVTRSLCQKCNAEVKFKRRGFILSPGKHSGELCCPHIRLPCWYKLCRDPSIDDRPSYNVSHYLHALLMYYFNRNQCEMLNYECFSSVVYKSYAEDFRGSITARNRLHSHFTVASNPYCCYVVQV